jgi:hypothetical protein
MRQIAFNLTSASVIVAARNKTTLKPNIGE